MVKFVRINSYRKNGFLEFPELKFLDRVLLIFISILVKFYVL